MENMKLVIDQMSDSLITRLSEVKFWDEDIKSVVKAHLLLAVEDCYKAEISILEEEHLKLKEDYWKEKNGKIRHELRSQIAAIKPKKQYFKRIFHYAKNLNLYYLMRIWAKQHIGIKKLKEFDEWLTEQKVALGVS